jgi:hypothetical protein
MYRYKQKHRHRHQPVTQSGASVSQAALAIALPLHIIAVALHLHVANTFFLHSCPLLLFVYCSVCLSCLSVCCMRDFSFFVVFDRRLKADPGSCFFLRPSSHCRPGPGQPSKLQRVQVRVRLQPNASWIWWYNPAKKRSRYLQRLPPPFISHLPVFQVYSLSRRPRSRSHYLSLSHVS